LNEHAIGESRPSKDAIGKSAINKIDEVEEPPIPVNICECAVREIGRYVPAFRRNILERGELVVLVLPVHGPEVLLIDLK
jgi:hypothetical protein